MSLSFWEKKGTGTFTEKLFSHGKKYNFPLHTYIRSYSFSQRLHIPQNNQIHRGTRGKISISNENFYEISFLNMCWADDCLQLPLTNQKTLEWTTNYALDNSEYKPNADVNMSTSRKLLYNSVPNRANILMLYMAKPIKVNESTQKVMIFPTSIAIFIFYNGQT